ncbi:MAG TPA: DNA adenine methylase [Methanospirillum sp.]|uniref:DNA adenine methylase n=1 Tax=Methanospirillum sp. TaxID=45200 RepID=UPI002C5A2F6D|nr:DNA adenine methylase [Methanospirillum sp.]HWQ64013.1 DNA adenine methylase [Methanospirillum sp.]
MTPKSSTLIRSLRRKRSIADNEFAKPFLKWAGGKTQLLHEFDARFPENLKSGVLDRYIEPFIGGGAVFFFVMQLFSFKESVICDVNEELVLTYQVIRKDVEPLLILLQDFQFRYDALDEAGQKELFLEIRSELNVERSGFDFSSYGPSWIHRASQLLFLNKTCFNGLFRVNSSGEFNVPFGKYRNPGIVNEHNLRMASALLKNTTILHGDFSRCLEYIDSQTFVYLDPPYRPLTKSSSFTSYSRDGFSDQDQVRLRDFFDAVDRIGASVMLSNSDPGNEDPTDRFFDDLYEQYRIERVMAKRAINSNGEKRGSISEIIVMNYTE